MKNFKEKFFRRGDFFARNPYTDEILSIVYPYGTEENWELVTAFQGNFVGFNFENYKYLDKVEIWFFDVSEGQKRITTIFNQNYKKWQK